MIEHRLTKAAIALSIRVYADSTDGNRIRGMRALLHACATYIAGCDAPEDAYDRAAVARRLPEILTEAFRAFRTKPGWETLRQTYALDVGRDGAIPDLVQMHIGGLHRLLVVHDLVRIIPRILGDNMQWLESRLELHFGAQAQVVDHAWDDFRHLAYRDLIARINGESHRGNGGKFGATQLLTFATAGRVMLTFKRGDGQISYVADDSDPIGYRAGSNATATPYNVCVSMIEEVTNRWDLEKMKRNDSVWFG